MLKSLGADVLIEYKRDDFEQVLRDYDVVVNSQDAPTLEKSLKVLRPGGKVVSISGPPTKEFASELGLPWYVKLVTGLLSRSILKKAKRLGVDYSFLFMKANGKQLNELTKLIEAGTILPVMDRVYPLAEINEAMSYIESGRAKGKVVVRVKR
jgi:NADPH:quinone reductase-like Zn-dependent oxidoreductase